MGARQSSKLPPKNTQPPYKTENVQEKFRLLFLANGKTVCSKRVFELFGYVHEARISKIDPDFFNIGHRDSATTYRTLNPSEEEYRTVIRRITNRDCFRVDRIEKIDNPFLQRAFQLKKKKAGRGLYIEERLLFHGTKVEYADDICNFNFDWRRTERHKFGRGVSFSPNFTYASNYSDRWVYGKVIIVARALVGRYCLGTSDMELPPEGCDTSHNDTKQVLVKYEDDDFYPAYKITYHLEGQLKQHQKRR